MNSLYRCSLPTGSIRYNQDDNGTTALINVAGGKHGQFRNLLLAEGADPNQEQNSKRTAPLVNNRFTFSPWSP